MENFFRFAFRDFSIFSVVPESKLVFPLLPYAIIVFHVFYVVIYLFIVTVLYFCQNLKLKCMNKLRIINGIPIENCTFG